MSSTRRRIVALGALSAVLLAAATSAPAATAASVCAPPPAPPADPAQASAPPAPAVVTYPSPSSADVTRTSATLLAGLDTQGADATMAFEVGPTSAYGSCTPVRTLPAATGAQSLSQIVIGLQPGATVHFRLVVATAAGQVTGEDQVLTTLAAIPRLAPVTTIVGVRVGGLTAGAAQARVRAALARPLVFTWHGKRWKATPKQLGARADVAGAVARALTSAGATSVPVAITVDRAKVMRYVGYLDRLFSRPVRSGTVRLVGRKAEVVTPQTGRAVQRLQMERAITRTLQGASRAPIELLTTETQPPGTAQLSIVVRLGAQSLTVYKDGAVVLTTPVTTGRPALPTPVGSYDVAWRRSPYTFISPWPEGSAYWYPPAHVRWAMFFYDNDFLHDSSEPTSAFGRGSNFGPWASHGCVHVPSSVMQVLYTTVPDHTPVIVADA